MAYHHRKLTKRKKKHLAIRRKIQGTAERPRLTLFRSNRDIYAQLIDDTVGNTILSIDTREEKEKGIPASIAIAKKIATQIKNKKIKAVYLYSAGYPYHGRVKAFLQTVQAQLAPKTKNE